MRMLWSCPSAASTRSSLLLPFRLTRAIVRSSRSPQTQAPAVVLSFPVGLLGLVGLHVRVIVSHRRSRDQVHETDEEQDQSGGDDQAGDRTGYGPGSRPSLVMPERRDEEAAARPEGS